MNLLFFVGLMVASPRPYLPTPQEAQLLAAKERTRYALTQMPQVPHAFDALHYTVDITVDPIYDQDIDHAVVTARVVSLADTLSHYLAHLVGLTVDSVKVNGTPASFTRPDSTLIVNLGQTVPAGDTFEVAIYYHGTPQTGGGVFGGGLSISPTLVYADNEPFGIKRWLPILDDPREKALLDFYITVPAGYEVVANGSFQGADTVGTQVTHHWHEGYPITPYLIVFAAAVQYAVWWDTLNVQGHPLPNVTAVQEYDSVTAVGAFAHLEDMLNYFSETFGLYPFINEKYGHVHAPYCAMENQTNTFLEIAAWGDLVDWVVAHELAHQWWGDWVTLGDWRDIWLNEGFASYCEALYAGHRDGPEAYREYMQYQMDMAVTYEPYPPYPLYDPDDLFGWAVVYKKGASVLHMLRHVVGDSTFFQILRTYGQTYAYSNAITEDFKAICEQVSGMDLDWFFDEWVYAPGHPKYRWGYWTENNTLYLMVSQEPQNFGVPIFKMPIDIVIHTSTGTDTAVIWDSLQTQTFAIPYTGTLQNVEFDPYPWIMKEATYTGVAENGPSNPAPLVWLSPTGILRASQALPRGTVLELYRADGRRVLRMVNPRAGQALSLAPGVYLLRLQMPGRHLLHRKAWIVSP